MASAAAYVAGRIATNVLSWAKTATIAFAQIALTKWMINQQEHAADRVSDRQIATVEHAINVFLEDLNENIIPLFQGAYPDVPAAARLVPVSPQMEAFQQMMDNITNAPKTQEYVIAANQYHRANYFARMAFLSPGFQANVRLSATQVTSMIRGEVPISDVMEVLADVNERAAMVGRLGSTRVVTIATLGITRLRMEKAGRDELLKHVEMLEKVSPVASEVLFDELSIKPAARLAFAVQQAQLLQNDLQNLNNQLAQKAPYKLAILQTELQKAIAVLTLDAGKASMRNDFVPNFPALFAPAIKSVVDGISQTWQNKTTPDSAQDLGGHLTPTSVTTLA